eukprot:209116-Chlamydomonas_euryale.AAC.3
MGTCVKPECPCTLPGTSADLSFLRGSRSISISRSSSPQPLFHARESVAFLSCLSSSCPVGPHLSSPLPVPRTCPRLPSLPAAPWLATSATTLTHTRARRRSADTTAQTHCQHGFAAVAAAARRRRWRQRQSRRRRRPLTRATELPAGGSARAGSDPPTPRAPLAAVSWVNGGRAGAGGPAGEHTPVPDDRQQPIAAAITSQQASVGGSWRRRMRQGCGGREGG